MSQIASLQDDSGIVTGATQDSMPSISSSLPIRKRKQDVAMIEESLMEGNDKRFKSSYSDIVSSDDVLPDKDDASREEEEDEDQGEGTMTLDFKPLKRPPMSKARETRLEQNRKAARESRKRKKIMVEELQRSVTFFTRANLTLKQQNEELQRILLQAQSNIQQQAQVSTATNNVHTQVSVAAATSDANEASVSVNDDSRSSQQMQNLSCLTQQAQQAQTAAQAAATQAMFESQGFSPAAARAAAQTFVGPLMTSTTGADVKPAVSNGSNIAAANVNPVPFAPAVANTWPFVFTVAPFQMQFPTVNNAQQSQQVPNLNQLYALQLPYLAGLLGNNGSMAGLNFPVMQLAGLNNLTNNNSNQESTNNQQQ